MLLYFIFRSIGTVPTLPLQKTFFSTDIMYDQIPEGMIPILMQIMSTFLRKRRGRLSATVVIFIILIQQFSSHAESILNHYFFDRTLGVVCLSVLVFLTGYLLDWSYQLRVRYKTNDEVYRSFFEWNPGASYSLDLLGKFTSINNATMQISGYSREELLRMSFQPLIARGDQVRVLNLFKQVLSGQSVEFDCSIIIKSGEQRHLHLTAVPIYVMGNIVGCIGIASDVTEFVLLTRQKQEDLNLAKEIQRGLLPAPIMTEGLKIHGVYHPSNELSGDMYYWTQINDSKFGVLLLDVVGHGVASSLVSFSMWTRLKEHIELGRHPNDVVLDLTRHIQDHFSNNPSINSTIYFTAIYLQFDTNTNELNYVNAGHPPAFLINQKGELIKLTKGTVPIGLFPLEQMPPIEVETLKYETGSKLYLYSDGLSDLYGGHSNIEQFFNNPDPSMDLFNLLNNKIGNSAEQQDDITLVEIKF